MGLTCPAANCRADNDAQAETCERCGTPLREYARLLAYPAQLFNLGLSAAREGHVNRARDLFSSIVHWCPMDMEARNALATACFSLGDKVEARRHWETVLSRSPSNAHATQGIAALDGATESSRADLTRRGAKTHAQKSRSRSRKKRKKH